MDIFTFNSYRAYLKNWLIAQPRRGRGVQTRLCNATGIQTSFLSQVLRGRVDLSTEQGYEVSEFLGLGEEETHYFLLLIQFSRSQKSSLRLKRFFEKKIREVQQTKSDLSRALPNINVVTEESLQLYFTSWIYSAVHLTCLLPESKSIEKIADRLGLSPKRVRTVLEELERMGLIHSHKDGYTSGRTQMHVPQESPYLRQHQLNLKAKSLEMSQKGCEGLDYVSIVSVSHDDFRILQRQLIETLEKARETINASPAEDIYIFNLGFAKLL